ncbi:MAG: hypothetical protein LUP94_02455 [Candidatus Methanomethylicus sp.]|nr:hypothetical protein [Candidatus Methanomethylicus sp.]
MANRFSGWISRNKLFSCFLIMTILVANSTFILTPSQHPSLELPTITVAGKGSFDLNDYPSLDRRVIGLVNLFRDYYDVTNLSYASVNDLSVLPPIYTHYFLPFTTYGIAMIADSTPSFRTDYYKDIFHKLIAMMNSSAMEQLEWVKPGFTNSSYAGTGNDFRGPTNIMWTGHFTLMELFYESIYRDNTYSSEITGYLDQWNSSLTSSTAWDGNPSGDLGRWGTGLIPCEPYIVFVQCNAIPFYTMRLYDNLHGTSYQEASLPGIAWWQEHMMDPRGIPIDGYYVMQPLERHRTQGGGFQIYPGPAMTKGLDAPKVSAYGSAWITMFYNAMGMEPLADSLYGNWKSAFVHYSADNTAYVVESYYFPHDFGASEYVANLFAYFCSREMGDSELNAKLENWFYKPFEGKWIGDRYEFDTSALGSLSAFTYPVINFAWAWGHANSTLSDLMTPRGDAFFAKPYISNQSRMDGLYVYQACYDEDREAFILTVETEHSQVLTIDNAAGIQGVYTSKGTYIDWTLDSNQLLLNLEPGTYSFVII